MQPSTQLSQESAPRLQKSKQREEGHNHPSLGLKGVFEDATQREDEGLPTGLLLSGAQDFSQTSQSRATESPDDSGGNAPRQMLHV